MTETKKLASAANYFNQLREEGLKEEKENRGYVWTILIDDTSHVKALGLADVEYKLRLNCSHVGETPFGVYRGEMGMEFDADCSGALNILKLLGFSSEEDLKGSFENDSFVMKLKPYQSIDEKEFINTFDISRNELSAEEAAGKELLNALIGAFVSGSEKDERTPAGLWYDWSFHMTGGDMGTYVKFNGGAFPLYYGNASASTDSSGSNLHSDATVTTAFTGPISERYDEPVDSPFPYTIKIYENNDVLFTLYNAKGGPVNVTFKGTIDRVPVDQTVIAKQA